MALWKCELSYDEKINRYNKMIKMQIQILLKRKDEQRRERKLPKTKCMYCIKKYHQANKGLFRQICTSVFAGAHADVADELRLF